MDKTAYITNIYFSHNLETKSKIKVPGLVSEETSLPGCLLCPHMASLL